MKISKKRKFDKKKLTGASSVKPNAIKLLVASLAISVSVGATLPSIASTINSESDVSTSSTEDATGTDAGPSADLNVQVQNVTSAVSECANPDNLNGLAHAQAETLDDLKTMILTPVNMDKIFDVSNKGGCFDALKDFPNLSVSIPSLSSIATALQKTLINYATRKVCTAVNDALSDLIDPINELFDKLGSNGQIDLTGAINKEVSKKLYEIDPEIGRVSTPVKTEYNWTVGDVLDSTIESQGGIVSSDKAKSASSSTATQSLDASNDLAQANGNLESVPKEESSLMQSTRNVFSKLFN